MHSRPDLTEAELARTYRLHSTALREMARFDCDLKTTQVLRRIATDYDHMADVLQQLDRTNQSVGQPSAVGRTRLLKTA
jgi:hypothetical protein